MNSLPKTATRQRRGCDLNPGPSAPESSTLTTRLPSHPDHVTTNSCVASYLRTVSSSSFLIRSSSSTASCVAFRSVSSLRFTFSTSARTFFSRSRLSCICTSPDDTGRAVNSRETNCPRSTIDVRPTALRLPHVQEAAAAGLGRATPHATSR